MATESEKLNILDAPQHFRAAQHHTTDGMVQDVLFNVLGDMRPGEIESYLNYLKIFFYWDQIHKIAESGGIDADAFMKEAIKISSTNFWLEYFKKIHGNHPELIASFQIALGADNIDGLADASTTINDPFYGSAVPLLGLSVLVGDRLESLPKVGQGIEGRTSWKAALEVSRFVITPASSLDVLVNRYKLLYPETIDGSPISAYKILVNNDAFQQTRLDVDPQDPDLSEMVGLGVYKSKTFYCPGKPLSERIFQTMGKIVNQPAYQEHLRQAVTFKPAA